MARRLVEENLKKIEEIVGSSILYSEKERKMLKIDGHFIEDYCNNKEGFVTFPLSKIIKPYSFLKPRMVKTEFIGFACNNWVFHRNVAPTQWDLIDKCLYKKIIEKSENWGQYRPEDLRYLIDKSNSKGTTDITGKILFTKDIYLNYLHSCPPNDFNLRNECIHRHLVSREEFGKKPKNSEFYENLMSFTPIVKEMEMNMEIWATYCGYQQNDIGSNNYSYFDFLGVKKFPKKLGKYIDMQESGDVDRYNIVANRCNKNFIENIEDIFYTMEDFNYTSYSENRIRVTFLKEKYPTALDEIRYTGKCNRSSKLIKLKIAEVLRV